jgi:hypothetical protein
MEEKERLEPSLLLNPRFTLTLKEASLYFYIGEKKLRQLANEHPRRKVSGIQREKGLDHSRAV